MRNNLLTIILLYLLSVTPRLSGQQLMDIAHYDLEDGLTQGVIPQIMQDKRGYIWFASWDGLIRFDGYTFKVYKGRPGDGNQLSINRFQRVEEDANGNLWCRVGREAIFFDVRKEHFFSVLSTAGIKALQNNTVSHVKPLKKQAVWLFYENGDVYRSDLTQPLEKSIRSFPATHSWGRINKVYEDKQGREWLLTEKGVVIYDHGLQTTSASSTGFAEWNGKIVLGFADGRFGFWNDNTRQIDYIYTHAPLGRITSLTVLDANRLIITSSTEGAFVYHAQTKQVTTIPIPNNGLNPQAIASAFVDRKGNVWLEPLSLGVIRHVPSTGQSAWMEANIQYPKVDRGVVSMYEIREDVKGRIWILLQDRNLWHYDNERGRLKTVFEVMNRKQPIVADPAVRGFLSDVQGNLWVNTAERGVEKISFFDLNYTLNTIDDVIEVRAFLLDSNHNLWVASKDDKIRIYDSSKRFKGFLSSSGKLTSGGNTLRTRVYSFCEDLAGNVWMGTKSDGLFRLLPNGRNGEIDYRISSFRHDKTDPYSISGNSIYSIFQDSEKRIWIGVYGGGLNLIRPDRTGNIRFLNANNEMKNYPIAQAPRVRCMQEIPGKLLLIATTEGLVSLSLCSQELSSYRFTFYQRDWNDPHSLSNNDVMHIQTMKSGDVFVATSGGGLDKVTTEELNGRQQLRFHSVTTQEGLASDHLLSIIEDKEASLWIVSDNALSRYFPQTGKIENFTASYFRNKFNFSEVHPVLNNQGELLFGCDKGFLEVDVDQMKKSSYAPTIGLSGLRIHSADDHSRKIENIEYLDELILLPNERNITIQFAALDYISAQDIRYAYRLRGLDKDWNYIGNARSAIYTNLPKGKYCFEVRSTNSDGIWVKNTRELIINVRPRFVETVWAWLLLFILILLLAVAGIYIYLMIYKLRHQVTIEEQLTQLKLQFFTDISHELRTPLTLIASPLEEVIEHEKLSEKGRRNLKLVQRNADRLLVLINQILDFRKIQNRRMRLSVEECNVTQTVRSLMENFLLLAEEKGLDFSLHVSREDISLWADRDKLEKIVINLLSNAFKYTPKGKRITLSIDENDKEVVIKIEDEGTGIDRKQIETLFIRFEAFLKNNTSSPSTGIGLSLVKNLIELHHGTIEVESEEGKGSCFTVRLLKGKEHFEQDETVSFVLKEESVAHCEMNNSEETTGSPTSEKQKHTLLVVEDNDELRAFLLSVLSPLYKVIEAVNGEDGLQKVYAEMPDMILSDVMMPVMDGLEMVTHIKQDPNICHTPIVILSAKSSLDDRIKGLESGIDDYITKPFSAAYLKARLSSIFNRREQLKEHMRQAIKETILEQDEKNKEVNFADLSPEQPQVESFDQQFVNNLMEVMEREMSNVDLVIDDLAEALCMSRTVFYKKLKTLTGYSPVDFIRTIRIKRAVQFIERGQLSMSEVAYQTGFNDPKYFSKCFKKEVGRSPSDYKNWFLNESTEA